MPASLYVFTPGDVVHVQVDPRGPVRSYTVGDDGSVREVGQPAGAFLPGNGSTREPSTLANISSGDLRNPGPPSGAHSRSAK